MWTNCCGCRVKGVINLSQEDLKQERRETNIYWGLKRCQGRSWSFLSNSERRWCLSEMGAKKRGLQGCVWPQGPCWEGVPSRSKETVRRPCHRPRGRGLGQGAASTWDGLVRKGLCKGKLVSLMWRRWREKFSQRLWLSGKESACKYRRLRRWGIDPWIGKIPGRRKWQPTPGILARNTPWREEPGGLQSMGSQRVGPD